MSFLSGKIKRGMSDEEAMGKKAKSIKSSTPPLSRSESEGIEKGGEGEEAKGVMGICLFPTWLKAKVQMM